MLNNGMRSTKMKRIKMWFLKVFFPKKYYEELGKESANALRNPVTS